MNRRNEFLYTQIITNKTWRYSTKFNLKIVSRIFQNKNSHKSCERECYNHDFAYNRIPFSGSCATSNRTQVKSF